MSNGTENKQRYEINFNNTTMEVTVQLDGGVNEPIRVIYEMMKEQKLTYRELYISEIAEQFMNVVKQMVAAKKSADDVLSPSEANSLMEFLLVASQLVREKAEYLTRKYAYGQGDDFDFDESFGDEDYDGDYPSVQTMLRSYIRDVEEVMEELKERETLNRFFAKPMEQFQHTIISYVDFDLNKLYDAIINIQGTYAVRKEQAFGVTIKKERSSVSGKIYSLKVLLTQQPKLELNYLLLDTGSLDEKICLFLAVLQLLKQQVARVEYEEERCFLCVDENWDKIIEEGEKDEFDTD